MTKEEKERYLKYLADKKLAPLPLDNMWHQLFPNRKPTQIANLEETVNELVQREGGLRSELKEMKRMKEYLMKEIVDNMNQESNPNNIKKMEDRQRQIIEINARTIEYEDELLQVPAKLRQANQDLMLLTMDYCYEKLHENQKEINSIDEWINKVRIELKKNVLRKQEKEETNRKMYTYMNDVFGPSVCNIFDYEEDKKTKK